jgi:hypothetical protein
MQRQRRAALHIKNVLISIELAPAEQQSHGNHKNLNTTPRGDGRRCAGARVSLLLSLDCRECSGESQRRPMRLSSPLLDSRSLSLPCSTALSTACSVVCRGVCAPCYIHVCVISPERCIRTHQECTIVFNHCLLVGSVYPAGISLVLLFSKAGNCARQFLSNHGTEIESYFVLIVCQTNYTYKIEYQWIEVYYRRG